jgi:hypothetical protein
MSGWGRMNGGSGTFGGKSPPKTECDKIKPRPRRRAQTAAALNRLDLERAIVASTAP